MSFASLEEAKEYYSSYAKRTGFSIRTNTSCRSAITREMQKVHFVCNKEGFGRKRIVAQFDGCKKRKREKMLYTNCMTSMVVKLIGSRWQIIYFMAEHNHDLVVNPPLNKFLRSHKGIPRKDKDFIVFLHGCNLSILKPHIINIMNESPYNNI